MLPAPSYRRGGGTTNLNISGAQFISRAAVISPDNPYTITLEITGDYKRTQSETGTLSELKGTTFTFGYIPLGVTITVTCRIVYHKGTAQEQLVYEGTSEPITISEITNSTSIKMTQKYQNRGSLDKTTFQSLVPNYATITEYSIPYGYTSIGNYVFEGCTELTRLTIPASVTQFANGICRNCTNLTTVIMESETPPYINGSTPFAGCTSLTTIYVPSGSVDAYKAKLSSNSDKIRAMP